MSKISRGRTVAYVRKQKSVAGGGEAGGAEVDEPDKATETAETAAAQPEKSVETAEAARTAAQPEDRTAGAAEGSPRLGPSPETIPPPTKPVDPERARVDTVTMPAQASLGEPPAMPEGTAVMVAVDVGTAEDPTRMPGPREIPSGHPDDPAPPPGIVPRGDSRSMRRRTDHDEFALIYRIQTYVITRFGNVGTRGQWRVVEYPTSAAAGHAYAKECSRFVSEGFSDYRA